MTILELGCGTGVHTERFTKEGMIVHAIDISPDFINQAKTRVPQASFVATPAETLPYPNNTFDAVIGISTLHHVDLQPTITEAYRVLKKGGKFVFTEPNKLNPLVYAQLKIKFVRHVMHISDDETAFNRWKLAQTLRETGFNNVTITPFDMLHPQTPTNLANTLVIISDVAEKIPIIREILGSLKILATK